MEKKATPRGASSPANHDSSPAGSRNDSFLEDMELFSHDTNIYMSSKEAERHVTRRTLSPAVVPFAAVMEEQDNLAGQKIVQNSNYLKVPARKSNRREAASSDGISQPGTSARELKAKIQESKARGQDNKANPKPSDSKAPEIQSRPQNESSRLQHERKALGKDRARRSGSCKESDKSGEAFKENKQPSNLSNQANSTPEIGKDHPRRSDGGKKLDSREIPESVALLSAVKEVVSTYTKEEGIKILRALNELHILGQASLIKNLMFQTDEIRKDLQLGENLGQLKVLMAEKEILKENCARLIMKNEDLQRRLEETERLKEENAELKRRLQEIAGRKSN